MHIYVSETFAGQPMEFDKSHHLFMLHLSRLRERLKEGNDLRPVLEMSAGKFAHDEGVADDVAVIQQLHKPGRSLPQMRHPNRAIDQDHATGRPFFGEESASIAFRYRLIRRVACCFPC